MTIGIDGSRAFIKGRTGTENYSYQLLRHLSYIDIENQYLIYIKKSQISKFKSQNFPANFKYQVIGLSRLWTQIGLAFRTFIDPIDVLFVPSHTLPLLRRPGLKTVITVHDLGAEYLPVLHQLKQVLYLKLMTHYQLKTANKIISVSKATKKDLMKRIGIADKKISVIYEGVDKAVFKKMPKDIVNDIVKKYDIVREKYFLFVGTIQPRKNLERLIKAFAKFLEGLEGREEREGLDNSFKLVLVGGKGWKSDSIYRMSKELGIEDRVRFLGRIPDEDLAGLYNGALALTYPSLFEGFGLPIVEAFACGCPVITSNSSSMPEVAGNAAILVNPYEQGEIFKAMRQIHNSEVLRNKMIQKGILCCKQFDWKTTVKRTIEVIKETISK